MKTRVILAALTALIVMATGALAAGGYNGGFSTSALKTGGGYSASPAEEQRRKEREMLTNCSFKTAARLGMPISSNMRYLPYEEEARCLVETGMVPLTANTPVEAEAAKIAEWHKLITAAPNYLPGTDARLNDKKNEKSIGPTLLGIKIGTLAEEVQGVDTTKKGSSWTLYSYTGSKVTYATFEKSTEYTPVLETTEITTAKGGRKRVAVQKIDPTNDAQIDKKPSEAKATKEQETSFLGKLKKIGGAVLDGMANSGVNSYSNISNKPAYKVGARETQKTRESASQEFAGVKLTDVRYMFDTKKGFVGFMGLIATREPFAVDEEPQFVAEIAQSVMKTAGTPIAVIKTTAPGSKTSENLLTVLTKDGFRVDIRCVDPGDKTCRNGYVQVRSLETGTVKAKDITNFFE